MRSVCIGQVMDRLPMYRDEWELIKRNQTVPDIMREICAAHVLYAKQYDKFSYMFYYKDPDKVAESIYRFLKDNITYLEESVDYQTSSLPAGILTRGYGDCKHYALMAAGILDSLNRTRGTNFDWCYCFAAYRKGAKDPYHVFVSVMDNSGTELWIDPTPGSGGDPTLLIKKRPLT